MGKDNERMNILDKIERGEVCSAGEKLDTVIREYY